MLDQVIEMVENMSEEEIQVLMNTEFPEELEKQASAELAKNDLYEGLYAYGANMAILELEAEESLDKTAAEQAESDDAELSQFIEEKVLEAAILEGDDEVALHKTAQVAAAYLFAGYADTLEKEAAAKGKAAAHLARMGKFLKKHKAKAGAGAAGVAALGAGAALAKRHMDKKASEMTVAEVTAEVLHNEEMMNMISADLEKCASKGKTIGTKAKASFNKAVSFVKEKAKAGHALAKKHPGKAAALGGAAVGAGALGAYMARKKKED